jgi:hypothetical protein
MGPELRRQDLLHLELLIGGLEVPAREPVGQVSNLRDQFRPEPDPVLSRAVSRSSTASPPDQSASGSSRHRLSLRCRWGGGERLELHPPSRSVHRVAAVSARRGDALLGSGCDVGFGAAGVRSFRTTNCRVWPTRHSHGSASRISVPGAVRPRAWAPCGVTGEAEPHFGAACPQIPHHPVEAGRVSPVSRRISRPPPSRMATPPAFAGGLR